MKTCPECNAEMEEFILPRHKVDLGGLEVVLVNSAHIRRCPDGHEEQVMIPDLEGLCAAAAMMRTLLPVQLSGKDLKFIRRALGLSQAAFAETAGVAEETISRWENGQRGAGNFSEKSVRHTVCSLLQDRVPGITYQPIMITKMTAHPLGDGEVLPTFRFERVRLKAVDGGKADAWDADAIAA